MRFFARLFSSTTKKEEDEFARTIFLLTGIRPTNLALYRLAFRHSSADGGKKNPHNNQRLEFLGDAILGACIAQYLYSSYPESDEGFLTSMRSKIVSRSNLNALAQAMGIQNFIVSKIDLRKNAKSIGGDALEALIGALYLDKGMETTQIFIYNKLLKEHLDIFNLENQVISYKGKVIEWAQKQRKPFEFVLLDSWGRQHNKSFKIGLYVNGNLVSSGVATSKKEAEELAATVAYRELTLT